MGFVFGQVEPPTVASDDPVGALTACAECGYRHVDPPRPKRPRHRRFDPALWWLWKPSRRPHDPQADGDG